MPLLPLKIEENVESTSPDFYFVYWACGAWTAACNMMIYKTLISADGKKKINNDLIYTLMSVASPLTTALQNSCRNL